MDFKQFAKPFVWEGATLWYLPYRHYMSDVSLRGLEAVTPQMEYVNEKTGERTHDEPKELAKARDKAAKLNLPANKIKTEWTARRLWGAMHDLFWLVIPSIVAVDMPENPSPVLSAFYAFHSTQNNDVAARWNDFNMIIASEMINGLTDGFAATRDNPVPAAEELAQATPPDDPKG